MIFNLGAEEPKYDLTVYGYPQATIKITDGRTTLTQKTGTNGSTIFSKLKKGNWNVEASAGTVTAAHSVEVGRKKSNSLNINAIPAFTYDGTYKIVDDSNNEITASLKDWKIRFLSGGILKFTDLRGAANGIDVFLVGGGGGGGKAIGQWSTETVDGVGYFSSGGGGGAGGCVKTKKDVAVKTASNYAITIGKGGKAGEKGKKTEAFDQNAEGGAYGKSPSDAMCNSYNGTGGVGTNGGGSGGNAAQYMNPGTNGSEGASEFGEKKIYYAGGGGGGRGTNGYFYGEDANGPVKNGGNAGGGKSGQNGTDNTGGGGGGGSIYANSNNNIASSTGAGGSGIVVIRNKR